LNNVAKKTELQALMDPVKSRNLDVVKDIPEIMLFAKQYLLLIKCNKLYISKVAAG